VIFLKTKTKIFLTVWTFFILGLIVFCGITTNKNEIHQGNGIKINLSTCYNIEIKTINAEIEVEGASEDYFQLKKFNGDVTLNSESKEIPLGFQGENYFFLTKTQISEGLWIRPDNNKTITLKFESKNKTDFIIVEIVNTKYKIIRWIFYTVLLGVLWLFIVSSMFDFKLRKR